MYHLHCTKKLLDRIKPSATKSDGASSTTLGNWYATVLFWKPQLALLVNERTLLPVFMPLAPATTLGQRFSQYLDLVLSAHGVSRAFIDAELAQMGEVSYAKTANRSVLGVMNMFEFHAQGYRDYFDMTDVLALSLKLSITPCSPLRKGAISPDRELKRLTQ
jgi:hypothetical protein